MKEGDIAQHWASLSKLESDWNQYKQLRNQVINVLKTEKDQWQERRLKTMGKDSGLVWKILNNWFGWNKQQSSPCQLVSDGCMYSKPSDLARILNEQLIKKVKDKHPICSKCTGWSYKTEVCNLCYPAVNAQKAM